MDKIIYLFVAAFLCLMSGCEPGVREGTLIVTQTPIVKDSTFKPQDILDVYYPPGSRIVAVSQPYNEGRYKVISKGFYSAGSPYISWDGKTVLFVGKEKRNSTWQIYASTVSGTVPTKLTDLPGGAMSPAVIFDGSIVFCSPVPKLNLSGANAQSAIYKRSVNGQISRLTFAPKTVYDLTVLRDGRILYVSESGLPDGPSPRSLYTINSDGTEVLKFALENDGAPYVRKPRELEEKRIGFLASESAAENMVRAECVNTARPFQSRGALFRFSNMNCSSVELGRNGSILVCLMNYGLSGRTMSGSFGVYEIKPEAVEPGAPLYDDPKWNDIEAVFALPLQRPQGRMSSVVMDKKSGNILCIDANFHREKGEKPSAVKVNVLTVSNGGAIETIGWSEVEKDGSFLLEIPADVPIGFETLDSNGSVIYRLAPVIWVRPGENRSCIGCHEPYNRSPKNYRPIAANSEPRVLKTGFKTSNQSMPVK
jgi:hypothetical protein